MSVVVLPHDPAWEAKFAGESARVMRALASTALSEARDSIVMLGTAS